MDAEPVPQSFLDRIRRIDEDAERPAYLGLDTPYPEEKEYFADENENKMRIMVTIPGGLERLSCLELAAKFGNESDILLRNGKIHFEVGKEKLSEVHQLRSVDNLFLNIADVEFDFEEHNSEEKMRSALFELAGKIDWSYVENMWMTNQPFVRKRSSKRTFSKSSASKAIFKEVDENGDFLATKNCRDFAAATFSLDKKVLKNNLKREDIRFRCSANRVGKKQCITSVLCANIFGGFVMDTAGWQFNLTEFNCHLMLVMMGKSIQIYLQLTNESLHRRNVVHFGITTLRPTICHGMLREAQISLGDIILDPMSGSGSMPIEGAICCKNRAFFIGTDLFAPALRRCELNKEHLDGLIEKLDLKPLNLDFGLMDATDLPFRDGSIDSVVTDLPFGKRIKEVMLGTNMRELYVSSLKELSRVTQKWGVFLCADKRSMKHAIETLCGDGLKLWRFIHCRMINHGGSRVGIYLFQKYDFFLRELKNKEN